jgi:hypothetical protein
MKEKNLDFGEPQSQRCRMSYSENSPRDFDRKAGSSNEKIKMSPCFPPSSTSFDLLRERIGQANQVGQRIMISQTLTQKV